MTENERTCPLCNSNNACGINQPEPCWCLQKSVPKALLAQVPSNQIDKTCICSKCIDQYNKIQQNPKI